VVASGLLCACYVWGAMAGSFRSLLWSNVVAAFAGSSTEALGAAMVNVSFFNIPCLYMHTCDIVEVFHIGSVSDHVL
jgi:hypothetical protein